MYATLRARAGGEAAVAVPWSSGARIVDVIQALLSQKPGLKGYVLDQGGQLVPYVSVFLDGRDIRHLRGLETPVGATAEIAIFPPVAGG